MSFAPTDANHRSVTSGRYPTGVVAISDPGVASPPVTASFKSTRPSASRNPLAFLLELRFVHGDCRAAVTVSVGFRSAGVAAGLMGVK